VRRSSVSISNVYLCYIGYPFVKPVSGSSSPEWVQPAAEVGGLFGVCFCIDVLAFCDWLFLVIHVVFFVYIATMADGR
jgi:hypothetical protein